MRYNVANRQIEHDAPIKVKDAPAPAETLTLGLEVVRQLGLKHWISSGTLLGLHRDGVLIPNDTDIDIGILTHQGNDFGPFGEAIVRCFPDRFRNFRTLSLDEKNVMQLAFRDEGQNNLVFDLFFYYIDLGREGEIVNINLRTPFLRKPAAMFERIEQWDSPLGPLPSPIDKDAYCEMRYGKNWRTPSNRKGIYNGQF